MERASCRKFLKGTETKGVQKLASMQAVLKAKTWDWLNLFRIQA